MPIFDEAADKFRENSTIVLGKVDCEKQTEIEKRYNYVFFYPNFVLFRIGQKSKHKYKEARTLEAFLTFIDKEMKDPMIEFDSLEELDSKLDHVDSKKRIFIGLFNEEDTVEYNTFRKVARNLQEDCQ